jgi:exopolysaccharide production protein ExoQ
VRGFINSSRVIAGAAVIAPLLSVYAPMGFAPLVGLAAVLGLVCRFYLGDRTAIVLPRGLIVVLTAFVVFAALSALWSIDRGTSLARFHRLVLILASGIVFIGVAMATGAEARAGLARWAIPGFIAALVVLAVERATGGVFVSLHSPPGDFNQFVNQFNRSVSVCAILVWPVVCMAARIRAFYGAALAATLFGLLFAFNSSAALAAMAVGAAAFGLVRLAPKTAGIGLGVVLSLSVLASPLLIRSLPPPKDVFDTLPIPRSSYHRLLVWDFSVGRTMERPILGWGFDSSRVMPGGHKQLDASEPALPLHPHNGALQLWLELGLIGALFGAAVTALAAETIRRRAADRLAQASASATLASAMVVICVSYGIWQTWWLAALSTATVFAVAACGRPPVRNAA